MLKSKKGGAAERRTSGQAITEYSAVMTMAIFIIIMMAFLLAAFTEYGWRVLSLIGDFPYSN